MPNARHTDPSTSHEAARSITAEQLTETQRAILELLGSRQMTDEQIARAHHVGCQAGAWSPASPSGLRSRRAELVERGLVEEKDRDKTRFGRSTIVWGLK